MDYSLFNTPLSYKRSLRKDGVPEVVVGGEMKYVDDVDDNLTGGSNTTQDDQSIKLCKISYTLKQPPKHPTYRQTNDNSRILFRCRICLQEEASGDDDDQPDGLLSPCRCKGTVGLVHRNCLRKWLLTSGKPNCELCGYSYIMTPSKKKTRSSQFSTLQTHFTRFTGGGGELSNLHNWLHWQQTRKHLITDIICMILLLPASYIGVHFCIVTANDYTEINPYGVQVIGLWILAILIILLFTIWTCLAIKHHLVNYRNYQYHQEQMALAEASRLSALPKYRFSIQPRPRGSSVVIHTLFNDNNRDQQSSPVSASREGQMSNESSIVGHMDLNESYNNNNRSEQCGNGTIVVSVALTTVPEVAEDCSSSQSKTAFTSIV